jgi:hypothetical protein
MEMAQDVRVPARTLAVELPAHDPASTIMGVGLEPVAVESRVNLLDLDLDALAHEQEEGGAVQSNRSVPADDVEGLLVAGLGDHDEAPMRHRLVQDPVQMLGEALRNVSRGERH